VRKLKNGILQGFLDITKESTEIPEVFAIWAGISTVSAVLKRNAFIDLGHFTVFPNTYIVLVAGSARCRKSTSIEMAASFIKNVKPGVKIMSQRMTPEALISSLSGHSAEGNSLISTAEGILIVDELSTLIDKNAFNSGLIPVLTKLYDSMDFTYETKSRGIELIHSPCLSLLGGSTLHWIKESIPKVAIGGGFTSRVIFVYRESPENLVPFPFISEETKKIRDDIKHDLNEIAKIRGEFVLSKDAKDIYGKEYKRFMKESPFFDSDNLSGYAGRRHIMLLKICMIVSAASKDDRKIEYDDMKIAINFIEIAEAGMDEVLSKIQSEPVGDIAEEVLSFIMKKKIVYRSTLVKKMTYKVTSAQLNIILDTLLEYRDSNGNKILTIEKEGNRTKYVYLK